MMKNPEHAISFIAEGLKLCGTLHLPRLAPLAVIIGCHGLMSDKNSPKQIELARHCTAVRMAYFRFDHRGCGESEGVFEAQTTLENRRADLIEAVQAAINAIGNQIPIGLFGSSLGGTICLTAARQVMPFAMVTLAAPVQSHTIRLPENSPLSLRNEILRHRIKFDITAHLTNIHHILVIHGDGDETVAVENAHRIYSIAQAPKKRLILENADHRISDRPHQKRFVETAVDWFCTCYREQFGELV